MLRDQWREFPRRLDSPKQLPDHLLHALHDSTPAGGELIHLYLIPQPRGFWDWFHDAPPRSDVFCLTTHAVVIVRELPDGSASSEVCMIDDILAIEVGTVLLKSWLTLTTNVGGELRTVTQHYGTVFSRQFRDTILWLRTLIQLGAQPPHHAWRMPGEEYVSALPLKFNNAARSFWLDSESALASCFIPPLTRPSRIISRIPRPYANATAIVVSNEAVCVVEEQGFSAVGRWGQTWRFLANRHLSSIATVQGERFPAAQFEPRSVPAPSGGAPAGPERPLNIRIPFPPEQQHDIESLLDVVRGQQYQCTNQAPSPTILR